MRLRHGPFGVKAADLQRELERRQQAHRRRLLPRRTLLGHLEQANRTLSEYARLLTEETAQLEAQQLDQLRELAAPPPDPARTHEQLRQVLETYRAAQSELLAGVWHLLTPYLNPTDSAQHRTNWRGMTAWLSDRTEKHTGSDAQ
ncbi:MAG TPA: hypothetical protein VK464_14645 [Symbiobacteriaceae bacterium]|jgi:hypothetical protein|nr:hypothetical protein [Symbiobacteriaceae bacterium]